jgi:hypothetical protein
MMAKIILLAAAMGSGNDLPIVFVSSFNAVAGEDCTLLSAPHASTYEVERIAAKRDGARLFVLGTVSVDESYCLLTRDNALLSGKIIQNPTIAFPDSYQHPSHGSAELTPATDAFLITTGTTYEGLRGPLAALIFTKSGQFSARYDQIGTIFVAKDRDFDPIQVISVLIYAKNGQKWLYTGKIEGKFLRFDRRGSPAVPYDPHPDCDLHPRFAPRAGPQVPNLPSCAPLRLG